MKMIMIMTMMMTVVIMITNIGNNTRKAKELFLSEGSYTLCRFWV